MELNKLIFGGLALGCLAAAAAGGYIAADRTPEWNPSVLAPAEAAAPVAGSRAVAESEGVITAEAPPAGPTRGRRAWDPPAPAATAPARSAEAPPVSISRRESAPRPSRTAPAPAPSPVPVTPTRTARNEPAAPTVPPASSPTSGGMWEARPSIEPERAPREPEPPPAPEFIELV